MFTCIALPFATEYRKKSQNNKNNCKILIFSPKNDIPTKFFGEKSDYLVAIYATTRICGGKIVYLHLEPFWFVPPPRPLLLSPEHVKVNNNIGIREAAKKSSSTSGSTTKRRGGRSDQ